MYLQFSNLYVDYLVGLALMILYLKTISLTNQVVTKTSR
jgi:hypothetical protein